MGITFWDDTVTKDMETLCSDKGNLLNGTSRLSDLLGCIESPEKKFLKQTRYLLE